MKRFLIKLLLGNRRRVSSRPTHTIRKRIQNLLVIWNNNHHDDVGIEKIFRLMLAGSQFLFPGIYIKHFFGKKGGDVQDLAMDAYILMKVLFPFLLIYFGEIHNTFLLYVVIWLVTETLLYVPTLIFASDYFTRPSSYRRSMLMLVLNYFEINFAFAYMYAHGSYTTPAFKTWYDCIYFSFSTFGTIGYGDFHPIGGIGKLLMIIQSVVFLSFVVLFINFFSSKVESHGYFKEEE